VHDEIHSDYCEPDADGWRAVHPRPAHPGRNRRSNVADGMTEAEIVAAYPDLECEDVAEALRYAAEAVLERELPMVDS
jgi:Protein of unknown function (DUF433)